MLTYELVSDPDPLLQLVSFDDDAVDEAEERRLVFVSLCEAQFVNKELESVSALLQLLR